MLFNSAEFLLVFLPAVLLVYFLLPHRRQNAFLVVASCIFYASWDWRFLFALLFTTGIDFYCAKRMEASISNGLPQAGRRRYLYISLATNLGLLGFFKYFNFFTQSMHDLLALFGLQVPFETLDIILPIGISFYTFQALSYTIDVYRGQFHATRSFWDFFLAVLYFPHLIAGPIQRAALLLPQITHPRHPTRDQVFDGAHLMLWGFFKKVYIADNLAPIVDGNFALSSAGGGNVALGVLAFTFQIYCDFSGYTDIARGIAKIMGFEFVLNFRLPYFATNPSDFWQRWHISLSQWLRDYLYISLGGNRDGAFRTYRNLMITMLLGGIWHGAAWNFVIWGFYQGILLIGHRAVSPALSAAERTLRLHGTPLSLVLRIASMFILTCYGWLLFRASSLAQISEMTVALAHPLRGFDTGTFQKILVLISPLVIVQVIQYRTGELIFVRLPWFKPSLRAVFYGALLYAMLFLGGQPQAFVYFQF